MIARPTARSCITAIAARRLNDVAYATLEWVAWCNTCRLLAPLGSPFPQPSMQRRVIGL